MKNISKKSLLESALDILRRAISGSPYVNQAQLARATGESEANISRWLSGASTPTLRKLEPILMALGARLVLPEDEEVAQRPVVMQFCYGKNERFVTRAEYTAVPVLGEVGAGNGMLPLEQEPENWIVIESGQASKSTIALKVGWNERSMLPHICPGDVVVVDMAKDIAMSEQHVYLVQEPPCEGSGYLLKRVQIKKDDSRTLVVFYSDNAAEGYAPLIYDLSLYTDGNIANAVRGRVIQRMTKNI